MPGAFRKPLQPRWFIDNVAVSRIHTSLLSSEAILALMLSAHTCVLGLEGEVLLRRVSQHCEDSDLQALDSLTFDSMFFIVRFVMHR